MNTKNHMSFSFLKNMLKYADIANINGVLTEVRITETGVKFISTGTADTFINDHLIQKAVFNGDNIWSIKNRLTNQKYTVSLYKVNETTGSVEQLNGFV